LTITGRWRGCPCARAASSIPQLQNAMPDAAAPLRKFLRVVIQTSLKVIPVARRRGPACFDLAMQLAKDGGGEQSFSTR
jgi:hypothetical protein